MGAHKKISSVPNDIDMKALIEAVKPWMLSLIAKGWSYTAIHASLYNGGLNFISESVVRNIVYNEKFGMSYRAFCKLSIKKRNELNKNWNKRMSIDRSALTKISVETLPKNIFDAVMFIAKTSKTDVVKSIVNSAVENTNNVKASFNLLKESSPEHSAACISDDNHELTQESELSRSEYDEYQYDGYEGEEETRTSESFIDTVVDPYSSYEENNYSDLDFDSFDKTSDEPVDINDVNDDEFYEELAKSKPEIYVVQSNDISLNNDIFKAPGIIRFRKDSSYNVQAGKSKILAKPSMAAPCLIACKNESEDKKYSNIWSKMWTFDSNDGNQFSVSENDILSGNIVITARNDREPLHVAACRA